MSDTQANKAELIILKSKIIKYNLPSNIELELVDVLNEFIDEPDEDEPHLAKMVYIKKIIDAKFKGTEFESKIIPIFNKHYGLEKIKSRERDRLNRLEYQNTWIKCEKCGEYMKQRYRAKHNDICIDNKQIIS